MVANQTPGSATRPGGPLRPGFDPRRNLSGRPRRGLALAEIIRRHTDWNELVPVVIEIAKGRGVRVQDGAGGGTIAVIQPRPSDQMNAMTWLAKYAGLEPPTRIDLDAGERPRLDFSRLAPAQVAAFADALGAALALEDPRSDPDRDQ